MTDQRSLDTRSHVGTVQHVSFRVDDLEVSLAFYEELLGCARIPRPEFPGPRGAWLKAGATEVHLMEFPANEATGFPPSEMIPYACHVAFHTDDLAGAEAALRQRGIPILRGALEAVPQFFVRDPSGNLIEFSPF